MKSMTTLGLIIGLLCLALSAQAGELEVYPDVEPSLPLALEDLGGHPHTLADYRGQVVLVNFWASWCHPCLAEMPAIQRLKQAMVNRPFSVLAINYKESKATAWKFRNLLKVNFTVLLDRDGDASKDWGVQIYPTSYLIDPAGRIRYVAYGMVTWDDKDMVKVINDLLDEPAGMDTGTVPVSARD
jgi:thiol-disulfide isomerase/thioredoxin